MISLVRHFKGPNGDLAGLLASTEACFESWRSRTVSERGSVAEAAARALHCYRRAFARLLSLERLQRIDQSNAEVDLSINAMTYYAKCALGLCARSHISSVFRDGQIGRETQGLVIHVQPSHVPLFSLARLVALNLTLGNVVVLTHEQGLSRSAMAFEHLWLKAGAPLGVFTNVAAGGCRALNSSDEVVDYRSTSTHGEDACVQEVLTSTRAGDGLSDLAGFAIAHEGRGRETNTLSSFRP